MQEITLKKCPFCGGEAELVHENGWQRVTGSRVECTVCHVKTESNPISTMYSADEAAADTWNRRV